MAMHDVLYDDFSMTALTELGRLTIHLVVIPRSGESILFLLVLGLRVVAALTVSAE